MAKPGSGMPANPPGAGTSGGKGADMPGGKHAPYPMSNPKK